MPRILMVLTNNDALGTTGKKTGFWLSEVAHPWERFTSAGAEVVFASPNGGPCPCDPGSMSACKDDEVCKAFLANDDIQAQVAASVKVSEATGDFDAIFYAGGHGPLWDLPENAEVAAKAAEIYGSGGVVAAVCHGPVGLVPIVDPATSEPLIKGKKVTCFSNLEEEAVHLTEAVPFSLEDRLREIGADIVVGEMWGAHVVTDNRVVTGQNPGSANGCAEATLAAIAESSKK